MELGKYSELFLQLFGEKILFPVMVGWAITAVRRAAVYEELIGKPSLSGTIGSSREVASLSKASLQPSSPSH